jgi:hypothetical protein
LKCYFYCGAHDHEVDEDQHNDKGFGGLTLVCCDEEKFENVELLVMVMVVMTAIAPHYCCILCHQTHREREREIKKEGKKEEGNLCGKGRASTNGVLFFITQPHVLGKQRPH